LASFPAISELNSVFRRLIFLVIKFIDQGKAFSGEIVSKIPFPIGIETEIQFNRFVSNAKP
jgi:hypothetical protein